MLKILLIGGYGLLGQDIYETLISNNFEVFRFDKKELNLLDAQSIKAQIGRCSPEVIIHAAGYTDVNHAEVDFENAIALNVLGMYNLIKAINSPAIPLFYFSTDYVFNGKKQEPYIENDARAPVNKYGWTKLISEDVLRANYEAYYIFRTSWLFGNRKTCFPKQIIKRLLETEENISVVCDQIGTPTYTKDIAVALIEFIQKKIPYGIYHLTNDGQTSWYQFAVEAADFLSIDSSRIHPIPTSDYKSLVARPQYSVLSNYKRCQYQVEMRDYKEALKEFLANLKTA